MECGDRPPSGHLVDAGLNWDFLLYQWGPGLDLVQCCAPTDSGLGDLGVPEKVREVIVQRIARLMPPVSNTARGSRPSPKLHSLRRYCRPSCPVC